jgi:flagellar basal-body rod protein FlgC
MTLHAIFDIASSGMQAETMRLTSSAHNLANANSTSSSADATYKAQYPVYKAVQEDATHWFGEDKKPGVEVTQVIRSKAEPIQTFDPKNPLADDKGFVYTPPINAVQEMADMISATRTYQMHIEMLNHVKQLMHSTLKLGE